MRAPSHIARPPDRVGVLRTGDDEPPLFPVTRRIDEQPLQHRLAVGTVGSEIAEVPLRGALLAVVVSGIERAVESTRERRAITALDPAQCWTSGEGEIEIEVRDEIRR